jgi:hypothetical protein
MEAGGWGGGCRQGAGDGEREAGMGLGAGVGLGWEARGHRGDVIPSMAVEEVSVQTSLFVRKRV